MCHQHFDELDVDKSGTLEPVELIPVIIDLCQALPDSLDLTKAERFTRLFDTHGNGVIMRDEFIEFAQFLTVMSFLESEKGAKVKQKVDLTSGISKTKTLMARLEED